MKKLFLLVPVFTILLLAGCSDKKTIVDETSSVKNEESHEGHDHSDGNHDHPHDETGNHEGHDHSDGNHDHPHDETGNHEGHNHKNMEAAFETLQFSNNLSQTTNGLDVVITHKDPHVGDNISFKASVSGINGFDRVDGEIGNLVYRKKGTNAFSTNHSVANTSNSVSRLLSFKEAADYELIAHFVIDGEEFMVPYLLKVHPEGDHNH